MKSCQNSSVDTFFSEKYLAFSNNEKIESHDGNVTFHILDRIPSEKFCELEPGSNLEICLSDSSL